MAHRLFVAAASALAASVILSSPVPARTPAPLLPTALVEDVKSTAATVEFMDYVGSGQVIALEPTGVVILSYLRSCEHETITGGTVTVGMERSEVQGGQVVRTKVACDDGKVRLSASQASVSGASAFRLQSAEIRPTLYARSPVIQLPAGTAAGNRTLLIERTDRRGERHVVSIDDKAVDASFVDLAKSKVRLARGGVYKASLDGRALTFKIDAKAKTDTGPVVGRLLRYP